MYSPRHARPSCLPLRAAVTTSLSAVLLPIALAAPALAQETAPTTTSTSDTSTVAVAGSAFKDWRHQTSMRISADPTMSDGRSRIGIRLMADGRNVADDQVVVEGRNATTGWTEIARLTTDSNGLAVGHLPFSRDTQVRATSAGDARRTAAVSPEALVRHRTPSSMRISGSDVAADGRARIGVRLLNSNGGHIAGEYVAIEAKNADGTWRYVGRVLTDEFGHGVGRLPFNRSTRIRAGFSGNSTSLGSRSPETVVRAASTLGQRAVQIASQQAGKPYRYGSAGPNSFDCSGYVTYIYKTRLGKNIPRTSAQQEASIPRVAQSAKRAGDLLFFRTGGRVSHVGVYAGGNKMWVSPTTGDRVKLQTIYTSRYTVGRIS